MSWCLNLMCSVRMDPVQFPLKMLSNEQCLVLQLHNYGIDGINCLCEVKATGLAVRLSSCSQIVPKPLELWASVSRNVCYPRSKYLSRVSFRKAWIRLSNSIWCALVHLKLILWKFGMRSTLDRIILRKLMSSTLLLGGSMCLSAFLVLPLLDLVSRFLLQWVSSKIWYHSL